MQTGRCQPAEDLLINALRRSKADTIYNRYEDSEPEEAANDDDDSEEEEEEEEEDPEDEDDVEGMFIHDSSLPLGSHFYSIPNCLI